MGSRSERSFEDTLWEAADKLRNNLDAAEYKHVVLGLVFLKSIQSAHPFRIPPPARWDTLARHAQQPDIGKRVDAAMEALERGNPSLRGALPRDYARQTLDPRKLGELVELVGNLGLEQQGQGRDILGHVYEYFLAKFARAEGKNGGQFYTPRCVVKLLAEMLAPYQGRVYDPCCGSGGMFVQSERFLRENRYSSTRPRFSLTSALNRRQ